MIKDPFEHWDKPNWDEYFMGMALFISSRSIDPSAKHGAVIVDKKNKILIVGYNGPPQGSTDSKVILKRPHKYLFMEHAEKNAIINKQLPLEDSTLYVTGPPCVQCMRSIIQSGIKRIVYGPFKSRDIKQIDDEVMDILLSNRDDIKVEEYQGDILKCLKRSIEYYETKINLINERKNNETITNSTTTSQPTTQTMPTLTTPTTQLPPAQALLTQTPSTLSTQTPTTTPTITPSTNPTIIGLTGSLGSGKSIVADFLKENGFAKLTLSNILRNELTRNNLPESRKNLQDVGNKLRAEHGNHILAETAYNKIITEKINKAIIDGIRNPGEIEFLKKQPNFHLIAVDAPEEKRFEMLKERKRQGDILTWEEFQRLDARDRGIGEEETGQAVAKCINLADHTLINDENQEIVKQRLEDLYKQITNDITAPQHL